ncbi:DUF6445 family protein [Alteromonas flava]|uniref:DUF6445 family protein n=1 Tax=Alteromonas flava TaxID=2048003 RepID=UPI000C28ABF7|nr:DUF6445 family protein [Alteromonas flava]
MQYPINRGATPYLSQVGEQKTPVFILDNFLENQASSLIETCNSMHFDNASTYYPGIRAKLPDEYVLHVAQALIPVLRKIYVIPANYSVEFFDSFFSLVTCEPENLTKEQQIPHFDGTDQYRFALLHYLNPNPHGGTALFQHKPTQIERVTEQNVNQYLSSVSAYFNQQGSPTGRYIDDSNQQFNKIGEIPYMPNRLAIYPGNLLHSGVINPSTDIDENPRTGRLTANIFLNFKAQ